MVHSFYVLYGHLNVESLASFSVGKKISAGEQLGTIGAQDVNGGWPTHLHLQIILDPLELDCDFPGVFRASEREVWSAFSPDPNLILKLPLSKASTEETLAHRKNVIGVNVRRLRIAILSRLFAVGCSICTMKMAENISMLTTMFRMLVIAIPVL